MHYWQVFDGNHHNESFVLKALKEKLIRLQTLKNYTVFNINIYTYTFIFFGILLIVMSSVTGRVIFQRLYLWLTSAIINAHVQ